MIYFIFITRLTAVWFPDISDYFYLWRAKASWTTGPLYPTISTKVDASPHKTMTVRRRDTCILE